MNEITADNVTTAFEKVEANFIRTNRYGLTAWTSAIRKVFDRFVESRKARDTAIGKELLRADIAAKLLPQSKERDEVIDRIAAIKGLLGVLLVTVSILFASDEFTRRARRKGGRRNDSVEMKVLAL